MCEIDKFQTFPSYTVIGMHLSISRWGIGTPYVSAFQRLALSHLPYLRDGQDLHTGELR